MSHGTNLTEETAVEDRQEYESVRTSVDANVGFVVINRPPRNAFLPSTIVEIRDAIARFDDEPSVRCIVLAGDGKHFSAGADMAQGGYLDTSSGTIDRAGIARAKAEALEQFPQGGRSLLVAATPIVAAINGAAVGAGACLALQADLRVMATNSRLVLSFPKRALTPEKGVSWLLPRLIGYSRAAQLLLAGRELDGTEAVAYGLALSAEAPEDLFDRASDLAHDIAANSSPIAVALTKRLLWGSAVIDDLESAAVLESQVIDWISANGDVGEGIMSFMEKRDADWTEFTDPADLPVIPKLMKDSSEIDI